VRSQFSEEQGLFWELPEERMPRSGTPRLHGNGRDSMHSSPSSLANDQGADDGNHLQHRQHQQQQHSSSTTKRLPSPLLLSNNSTGSNSNSSNNDQESHKVSHEIPREFQEHKPSDKPDPTSLASKLSTTRNGSERSCTSTTAASSSTTTTSTTAVSTTTAPACSAATKHQEKPNVTPRVVRVGTHRSPSSSDDELSFNNRSAMLKQVLPSKPTVTVPASALIDSPPREYDRATDDDKDAANDCDKGDASDDDNGDTNDDASDDASDDANHGATVSSNNATATTTQATATTTSTASDDEDATDDSGSDTATTSGKPLPSDFECSEPMREAQVAVATKSSNASDANDDSGNKASTPSSTTNTTNGTHAPKPSTTPTRPAVPPSPTKPAATSMSSSSPLASATATSSTSSPSTTAASRPKAPLLPSPSSHITVTTSAPQPVIFRALVSDSSGDEMPSGQQFQYTDDETDAYLSSDTREINRTIQLSQRGLASAPKPVPIGFSDISGMMLTLRASDFLSHTYQRN
jgi:hypothetical protein